MQVRRLLKVRGDEPSWNIDFYPPIYYFALSSLYPCVTFYLAPPAISDCNSESLIGRIETLELELNTTQKQLNTTQGLIQDPRLSYFSRAMPKSKGSHSTARKQIKNTYGQICLFCGSNVAVTLAHLVAGNEDVDYSAFGIPTYRDNLNFNSARNFIPLCGTLGMDGTCHNEFDQYLITVVHNPFGEAGNQYKLQCLRPGFAKYEILNQKIISVKEPYPYRRLLAWRNRKCLMEHGHLCDNEVRDIVQAGDLSEIANSINDGADGDDADSGSVHGDDVDIDYEYGMPVKSVR